MNHIHGIVIVMLLVVSCAERYKHGQLLDTPTAGNITITVDESLRPLIQAEIAAFEGIYRNAHITAQYTGEKEGIDAILRDSASLTIVTRCLVES